MARKYRRDRNVYTGSLDPIVMYVSEDLIDRSGCDSGHAYPWMDLLLPGKKYGWPLYSKGLDYDGTAVEYGKVLGIELELPDIQQPVVDLTPSPAVSSFIFYEGSEFPEWKHNIIVGTLKAAELYRMVLVSNANMGIAA